MKVVYENVSKKYGSVVAVDQLNLTIESGEFVVLLGPSGCGKTTTLRMLAGLEELTAGNIFIGDCCVIDVPPRDRDIAMVFQSYALYPHMTVGENIAYPLRVRKVPAAEIPQRVGSVAELLSISDLLRRKPKELSGGQRQRVALARAIVRQPRLYLMDEPLSNLDAKLRLYMRSELKRLQYELGTTTIYVTHDQAEAMTLGHRIAVMEKGQLLQYSTPLSIYERPANKLVASFLGSPSMNFVDGEIDAANRRFVNQWFSISLNPEILSQLKDQKRLTLGVRPEDIRLAFNQTPNGLPAQVYVTESLGHETLVFLQLGQEKIIARAGPEIRVNIETTIWISFDDSRLHFFDTATGDRLC